MRIVLDTNVLARAFLGPTGLARELLQFATQPPHILVLSPFIIGELSRVLRYDHLRKRHGQDDASIGQFVFDLQQAALLIPSHADPAKMVAADPFDNAVVATAIDGQADVLCSRDRHLLDPVVVRLCRSHGVDVLGDIELIERLRAIARATP